MHITSYDQLVAAIASNTVFSQLSIADSEQDYQLQLFAQRAIIDFMLSVPAMFVLASAEHNETDVSILHEYLFDAATE